ncbi:hypothetical protein QJS10_CPB04g01374 [Acorus calamus]|uniref:Uncharacterized protein n=1 Tax=Acorus calamus TaxID=4465 RepID=A0AAV9EWR2_ACOCL|nr:hypothetical protein QJS10_CPB04g01374 [Acorus calamus]
MKREGRQHGLVRTHKLIFSPDHPRPSNLRIANEVSGPAMAGSFVKAPSKPTNLSKFTSKYSWSHVQPVSKSKEKAKGSHKFRSFDGGFSGWSSEEALRCLGGDDDYDVEADDELEESGFYCGMIIVWLRVGLVMVRGWVKLGWRLCWVVWMMIVRRRIGVLFEVDLGADHSLCLGVTK